MRNWIGVTGLALAVAMAACENGGEEGLEQMGAEDEAASSAAQELACQPSERMDVGGRTSPYDSTSIEVGEGTAKVCYGRPALKGRTMIGGEAVPYDTLWRTGANEPTTLHLNVPARIAGLDVEPGSYSLYTVPREGTEWTLIVNRSTSQWGHESTYTDEVRAQEVGRVEVQAETLESPVEQLTIRPVDQDDVAEGEGEGESRSEDDRGAPGQGLLLEWQNTRVHIPIAPAG